MSDALMRVELTQLGRVTEMSRSPFQLTSGDFLLGFALRGRDDARAEGRERAFGEAFLADVRAAVERSEQGAGLKALRPKLIAAEQALEAARRNLRRAEAELDAAAPGTKPAADAAKQRTALQAALEAADDALARLRDQAGALEGDLRDGFGTVVRAATTRKRESLSGRLATLKADLGSRPITVALTRYFAAEAEHEALAETGVAEGAALGVLRDFLDAHKARV